MNKIYIDEDSYTSLEVWAAENRQRVLILSDIFFHKCELFFKKTDLMAIVEEKKGKLKFAIKAAGRLAIAATVERTPHGVNDYKIVYKIKEGVDRDAAQVAVEEIVNIYLLVNAFMYYGNMAENRQLQAAGRNDGDDKIIVFREYNNSVYAVPLGSHRSPEGVFPVRGHLRRYKNGHVVWIDGYLKGLNK